MRLQLTITEDEVKTSKVDSVFRWWSKCISSTICRTASKNILFSSTRIGKIIDVDRRYISSNAERQEDEQRVDNFVV